MSSTTDPLKRDRWARLRFSIIGPLLAAPPAAGELQSALTLLAVKRWRHPPRASKCVSASRRWSAATTGHGALPTWSPPSETSCAATSSQPRSGTSPSFALAVHRISHAVSSWRTAEVTRYPGRHLLLVAANGRAKSSCHRRGRFGHPPIGAIDANLRDESIILNGGLMVIKLPATG